MSSLFLPVNLVVNPSVFLCLTIRELIRRKNKATWFHPERHKLSKEGNAMLLNESGKLAQAAVSKHPGSKEVISRSTLPQHFLTQDRWNKEKGKSCSKILQYNEHWTNRYLRSAAAQFGLKYRDSASFYVDRWDGISMPTHQTVLCHRRGHHSRDGSAEQPCQVSSQYMANQHAQHCLMAESFVCWLKITVALSTFRHAMIDSNSKDRLRNAGMSVHCCFSKHCCVVVVVTRLHQVNGLTLIYNFLQKCEPTTHKVKHTCVGAPKLVSPHVKLPSPQTRFDIRCQIFLFQNCFSCLYAHMEVLSSCSHKHKGMVSFQWMLRVIDCFTQQIYTPQSTSKDLAHAHVFIYKSWAITTASQVSGKERNFVIRSSIDHQLHHTTSKSRIRPGELRTDKMELKIVQPENYLWYIVSWAVLTKQPQTKRTQTLIKQSRIYKILRQHVTWICHDVETFLCIVLMFRDTHLLVQVSNCHLCLLCDVPLGKST